jgi:hypothetical protein
MDSTRIARIATHTSPVLGQTTFVGYYINGLLVDRRDFVGSPDRVRSMLTSRDWSVVDV